MKVAQFVGMALSLLGGSELMNPECCSYNSTIHTNSSGAFNRMFFFVYIDNTVPHFKTPFEILVPTGDDDVARLYGMVFGT